MPVDRQRYRGGDVVSLPQALAEVLAFVVTAAGLFFLLSCSPADPRCTQVLAHPDSEVDIPLPASCELITNAPTDQTTKYLEAERKRRGLDFKAWIRCKQSAGADPRELAFTHDRRWLPSYVPGSYQFRQTVIIAGNARIGAQFTGIVGEVCLMPRKMYISQISGQCDGKFAVGK